jgi:alkylation response protein AidB-like acyl-CoA dehydrogenase
MDAVAADHLGGCMNSGNDATEMIRAEVGEWLGVHWSDDLLLGDWWSRLAGAGFAFPTWPTGMGGRDMTRKDARVIAGELVKAGALGPPGGVGQMVGGPMITEYGTSEQRCRWVPALAAGAESWCQLFSEPGAGSDLASLALRAERDNNGWVLTGQKLWSREADTADRGLVLARTDTGVPKHVGISLFVVDLDQPGVEVRPIRQMNGRATFNEVFLTGVAVPAGNLIGAEGQGWRLAQASLAYERQEVGGAGELRFARIAVPGRRGGMLSRPIRELAAEYRRAEQDRPGIRGTRTPAAMISLAQQLGRIADPVVRQRLTVMYAMADANRLRVERARAVARHGQRPGPEASIGKLISSALGRQARDLSLSLLGAEGLLAGNDAFEGGVFQHMALSVQSLSIAGGTDEIQHNLIGERVLGLPREPEADRGVPFRELKTGMRCAEPRAANP